MNSVGRTCQSRTQAKFVSHGIKHSSQSMRYWEAPRTPCMAVSHGQETSGPSNVCRLPFRTGPRPAQTGQIARQRSYPQSAPATCTGLGPLVVLAADTSGAFDAPAAKPAAVALARPKSINLAPDL